jgi:hypothetical protein
MNDRICIIGAGPSGLTAAKALLEEGFRHVTILDRGSRCGGNWVFEADSGHSSVFETTHIISSRTLSAFSDFPFPPGTPDYPHHTHLAAYFAAYADHFGVTPHIRFQRLVESCVQDGQGWRVRHRPDRDPDAPATEEHFDRLIVANGHHWKPRWPRWEGTFAGTLLHSHDYKRAAPFAGQRVLVVGGGNSACDVAVETSRVSARTDLSWRRGYWIVPKFLFGRPSDTIYGALVERAPWVPMRLRYSAMARLLRAMVGGNHVYGLPEPDHRFGETHPTVNSELHYFLRHGRIHPRPDIARLDGHDVVFTDGSRHTYDAIIACTGFEISHPFLDASLFDYSRGPVPLWHRMIHPTLDHIAFVGLFQPIGCIWPLSELQGRILARWWAGRWSPPPDRAAAIGRQLQRPHLRQIDTPRHTITVDYPTFRSELLRELQAPLRA